MAKKEEKTNAMRLLEQKGARYQAYHAELKEAPSGVEMARLLGLPEERVYKTLVTVGRSKAHYVFVIPVAEEYSDPEILDNIWVYEAEGIVKGLIRIADKEIVELYVDHFFQGQGIGAELIGFAIKEHDVRKLWVLEKNTDAIRFYEAHGFRVTDDKRLEEGTPEYKLLMKR